MELLKGAKQLQNDSDFINKIKKISNAEIFKPNVTIGLGALFITNCYGYINENKKLHITLAILDLPREINNVKHQLRGLLFFQKTKLQVILFYCKTHGECGSAVLDISLILFIKSDLLCRRFVPLSNYKGLVYKITVGSNTVVFEPMPHLAGAQITCLSSQLHYVSPTMLFWKFSRRIGAIFFL